MGKSVKNDGTLVTHAVLNAVNAAKSNRYSGSRTILVRQKKRLGRLRGHFLHDSAGIVAVEPSQVLAEDRGEEALPNGVHLPLA